MFTKPVELKNIASLQSLVNDHKIEMNKEKWDDFSELYTDSIQIFTV